MLVGHYSFSLFEGFTTLPDFEVPDLLNLLPSTPNLSTLTIFLSLALSATLRCSRPVGLARSCALVLLSICDYELGSGELK